MHGTGAGHDTARYTAAYQPPCAPGSPAGTLFTKHAARDTPGSSATTSGAATPALPVTSGTATPALVVDVSVSTGLGSAEPTPTTTAAPSRNSERTTYSMKKQVDQHEKNVKELTNKLQHLADERNRAQQQLGVARRERTDAQWQAAEARNTAAVVTTAAAVTTSRVAALEQKNQTLVQRVKQLDQQLGQARAAELEGAVLRIRVANLEAQHVADRRDLQQQREQLDLMSREREQGIELARTLGRNLVKEQAKADKKSKGKGKGKRSKKPAAPRKRHKRGDNDSDEEEEEEFDPDTAWYEEDENGVLEHYCDEDLRYAGIERCSTVATHPTHVSRPAAPQVHGLPGD